MVDTRLFPEYDGMRQVDILREQLFFISMVIKGSNWLDLLNLPDYERDKLYDLCVDFAERQEEEMNKIESQMKSKSSRIR